ncbi:DUF481 domain-containing protein [Methylonatrum kenyense]|uniref:DUF481 domain-containing protein n=1 Tax=Methylonatrum kenyense TaxID=455253 RepID=UPI0020C10352|nr:DUF481 domain-containing protein [Methylonatrum kenyense]MCK8516082.1 DUF481 domain-containing protein [Methylonatrum kenyense]
MKQRHILQSLMLLLLLASVGKVSADVLVLDNGDRITGTFIKADGSTVEFRPEQASDSVNIRWDRVVGLETDRTLYVRLEDGSKLVGQAVESDDGRLRLMSGQLAEPASVEFSAIEGANTSPTPAVRTSGNIAFGGSLTRGNTRTEAYNINADFEARTDVNRLRLFAEGARAKEDGDLSRESARGGMRYDHFVSKRLYLNSNLSLATDRFRDLKLRTIVGAGLGYQFFDTPQRVLSAELGLSYVNEEFREASNESRAAGRWAVDYQERLLGSRLRFFHNQEGFQGLEESRDLLVLTRTGLRFPLVLGMTGTAQVNVDYDRDPPAGNTTTDTAYLLTVGYSW